MYKLLSLFISALALSSCMSTYTIQGNINTNDADGSKLFLKAYDAKNLTLANLDSCEIVHGQFHFNGTVDSARIAAICIENTEICPVIVESGDVMICSNNTEFTLGGTPLNDKLYEFYKEFMQIMTEIDEVSNRTYAQNLMNGMSEEEAGTQATTELAKLNDRLHALITGCIKENYDNPLGPGVFFFITTKMQLPTLEPWIEELWMSATDSFKNDSYVKEYYSMAKQNQQIATGLIDSDNTPAVATETIAPAPTPNELAGTASADSTQVK